VAGGVLFVGDSAGHCLPLTAEGIRCAAYFGTAAGRLIAGALDGHLTRAEALHRYAALHERERRHYERLLHAQRAVPALAPGILELGARVVGTRRVGTRITRRYLSSLRPELLPAVP
jgi:flavin-dependent dehydrogenase